MADKTAGNAGIELHPDFAKFIDELRGGLEGIDASLSVEISADTAQATVDMDRWRADQKAKTVGVGVDLDAEQARLGLDELTRARVAFIEAKIEGVEERRAQLDELARARIAEVEARTAGTAESRAQLDELTRARTAVIQARVDRAASSTARRDLESFKSDLSDALKVNAQVVGVVGAAGFVSDLLAIVDAAGQASRALALLPALGLGALAGGAAAAIGARGIAATFKDYTASTADPVANAKAQQDALNGVAEAQYSVGTAEREQQTAARGLVQDEKDLNQAYTDSSRSIRDMNLSLNEQKISVSDAGIAVSEAAKNLQKIQLDPTADSDTRKKALNDYQDSIIRSQQAQNKQHDLTADTAQANALGVQGSAKVVEAQQKVTDGVQAQADAAHQLSQALVGVQKAQQQAADSSGQSKIASALAKLSPNARELVADVRSIGSAWHEMAQDGQDALTSRLGPAIENLATAQLPAFHKGVVDIDTALNSGLRSTIAELSTPSSKANFGVFLDNTAAGFHNAAGAAAPFTQAITTLATAGSKELPALGQAVDVMATKFDNLILRTSDGEFDAWMKQGITSGEQLGGILEHLGSSVASVFRAAGDGGSVVQNIDDLTAKMATFLKSGQGQSDLGSIFTELRQGAQDLTPLLKDLPGLLHGVIEGTQLWGSIAGPILHEIAQLLGDHPRLVELAIAAYLGFKTVKPLLDGVSTGLEALATRGGWVKPAAKEAGDAIEGLAAKAATGAGSGGGIGKFSAAAGGLLSVLGNPWTIAITSAAVGFLTFEESADRTTAAIQRYSAQAQQAIQDDNNLQKALQASGGNLDTGALSAITQNVSNLRQGYADNAHDLPGLVDKAQEGLTGIAAGITGIGTTALQNDRTRDDVGQASKASQDALNSIGLSNDQLTQKITGSKSAFDAMVDQLSKMGQGGKDAASDLQGLRDEWAIDAASVSPVTAAIKDLGTGEDNAAQKIDAATSALERQRQGGLTLEDANEKLNAALGSLGTSAQTAGGAIIDASGGIDTTSQAGRNLFGLINTQLVPAWEQVTTATIDNAKRSGENAEQAQQDGQKRSDAARDSAEKAIESMGYTQAQADELLKHYQPLAKNYNATITADTSQATAAIVAYEKFLDDTAKRDGPLPFILQPLQPGITSPKYYPGLSQPTSPSEQQVAPWLGSVTGHAGGGPVDGTGTTTSDSIVARLSRKEFVSKAASVDKYGLDFYKALNAGAIDPKLIAMLPGYATGGQPGSTPGAPGTSAQSGASNIGALDAFAQSLAGQPYGRALDCSGLISQLALKADGLDPSSGRMATSSEGPWLGALGWTIGNGSGNGVFSVGWIDDPNMPGGGHTAGTLPDGNNIEASGSAKKVLLGPSALGSNANLFTQHAYLNMSSATVNTAGGGLGTPAPGTLATPTPGVNSTSVLNPQVGAPAPLSNQQLEVVQDRAAFDSANSQRNAVYADPKSTQQDKTAADYAYDKAANTLGSAMQQQSSGAATLFSAQGAGTALGIGIGSVIGSAIGASIPGGQGAAANAGIGGQFGNKFGGQLGGVLAGGLLSSLGLDRSVLSEGNAWNSAFQQGIAASGAASGSAGAGLGALGYTPQNLPTIVTTTTQQGSPTNPATANYAGAGGTSAGIAANAALEHTYVPGAGAEQWLNTAKAILTATGRNPADAGITVTQIDDESHGDPNAVNNYDSNAAAGHPSKGLLQVIDTTFAAFQDPRFPGDVTTPAANIAAALNYVDSKYGGPEKIWPTTAGYADGGWLGGPGGPRTDSVPMMWWGSNGEYLHVTNAAGAQQNAPFLDAMNAGAQFQPLPMPSNYDPAAMAAGTGGETHYHNDVNVHDPRIMHMGEFMDHLNQQQARATLGGMGTWPV